MNSFRWKLFKLISAFGWWVCPEPHRTNLQRGMKFDFTETHSGPNNKVRDMWKIYADAKRKQEASHDA